MNFCIYIYMINKNLTVNLQSLQFLRMKYQSLNSILLYFDLYIFLFFFFWKLEGYSKYYYPEGRRENWGTQAREHVARISCFAGAQRSVSKHRFKFESWRQEQATRPMQTPHFVFCRVDCFVFSYTFSPFFLLYTYFFLLSPLFRSFS